MNESIRIPSIKNLSTLLDDLSNTLLVLLNGSSCVNRSHQVLGVEWVSDLDCFLFSSKTREDNDTCK